MKMWLEFFIVLPLVGFFISLLIPERAERTLSGGLDYTGLTPKWSRTFSTLLAL